MQNKCPLCELDYPVVGGVHTIQKAGKGNGILTYACTDIATCPRCGAEQLHKDWVSCAMCKSHKPGCQCFGCRFL